jgi:hypothetical protein
MLHAIAKLIKTENLRAQCEKKWREIVSTDPNLPFNKGKKTGRILAERIATCILTIIFLILAVIGLFMVMSASSQKLGEILIKLPNASPQVVNVVSELIAHGFAVLGQIVFVVSKAIQSAINVFGKKMATTTHGRLQRFFEFVSAFGNGGVAAVGAGGLSGFGVVAAAAATANAAFSTATEHDDSALIGSMHAITAKLEESPVPRSEQSAADDADDGADAQTRVDEVELPLLPQRQDHDFSLSDLPRSRSGSGPGPP